VSSKPVTKLIIFSIIAALMHFESAGAADLVIPSKKFRRVASLERVSYPPGECRVGWWQTLRAGHVRPHWAIRCR
jgi:hypothetical protein